VVDLVLTSDQPISGFEVYPATGTAGVFSIDITGWTASENLLFSHGLTATAPASCLRAELLDWLAISPQGVDISPAPSILLAPNAPTAEMLSRGLDGLAGPMTVTTGNLLRSEVPISGALHAPAGPGSTVVATLTLQVAGIPGTYRLTTADGYFADTTIRNGRITPAPALEVVVGSP
jgi:hypothetical protein